MNCATVKSSVDTYPGRPFLRWAGSKRQVLGTIKTIFQFADPPVEPPHRLVIPLGAARSSAATRASISSIAIALAAWFKTLSAALTSKPSHHACQAALNDALRARARILCHIQKSHSNCERRWGQPGSVSVPAAMRTRFPDRKHRVAVQER